MDKLKQLSAPFEEHEIEWRVGATNKKAQERTTNDKFAKPTKGVMLAYVTSRAIMDRLDSVLGVTNWKDEYYELHKGTMCKLSIRLSDEGEWITKEDGADLTDIEATKGGISDALKRAGVKFGIGRYLYNAETTWVELNEWGQPKVKPTLKLKDKPEPPISIEEACVKLSTATTLDELKVLYTELPTSTRNDNEVIAKKDELKNTLNK